MPADSLRQKTWLNKIPFCVYIAVGVGGGNRAHAAGKWGKVAWGLKDTEKGQGGEY